MIVHGAVHMHTTLSHDGKIPLDELVRFLSTQQYQFICITEHSQDVTAESMADLEQRCGQLSRPDFCVIPGIEFTCVATLHIMGLGVTAPCPSDDPAVVIDHIHAHGGVAVLAHPNIKPYPLEASWVRTLNGCELFNVSNEGKYLPQIGSLRTFARLQRWHPQLLAFAGLDLHRLSSFYRVALTVEAAEIDRVAILSSLRRGQYTITSRFFGVPSSGRLSPWYYAYVWCGRSLLNVGRWLRDIVSRG